MHLSRNAKKKYTHRAVVLLYEFFKFDSKYMFIADFKFEVSVPVVACLLICNASRQLRFQHLHILLYIYNKIRSSSVNW